MIQPGILAVGNSFFIKIEKFHMQLENANLQTAFSYLLGYYHVLYINYPLPLKFVYVFFESLMGIPLSINSTVVKRLVSNLAS